MKRLYECNVLCIEKTAVSGTDGVYRLTAEYPEIPKPGQFVNLYTGSDAMLLPRPISVCDYADGKLTLVFRAGGKGTRYIAERVGKSGEKLTVSSPLGNGYPMERAEGKRAFLIGGGVGVPPLLYAARALRLMGVHTTAVLGFRDSEGVFLEEEFLKTADEVHICTDDGSRGFSGNAAECLRRINGDNCAAFMCGPRPLLKAACELLADDSTNEIWVSLEERMGCGYGACVGCVTNVYEDGVAVMRRVCKVGPVFDGRNIIW